MRKDVADLWVAALRSGEYKQVIGLLSCEGGQCCLGVLEEVAVLEGAQPIKALREGYGYPVWKFGEEGEYAGLTIETVRWAGLSEDFGRLGEFSALPVDVPEGWGPHSCLSSVNDTETATFEGIADFIEANYAVL